MRSTLVPAPVLGLVNCTAFYVVGKGGGAEKSVRFANQLVRWEEI